MLIGLVGKKQSGKSTASAYLKDEYGFHEISFAERLKKAACILFDLTYEQVNGDSPLREVVIQKYGASPRMLLQWLGTEVLRNRWPDYHLWTVAEKVANNPDKNWVISDVRFPNEVELIRELGGHDVRIIRTHQPDSGDTHESEIALDKVKTTYTLHCDEGVGVVQDNIALLMTRLTDAV